MVSSQLKAEVCLCLWANRLWFSFGLLFKRFEGTGMTEEQRGTGFLKRKGQWEIILLFFTGFFFLPFLLLLLFFFF